MRPRARRALLLAIAFLAPLLAVNLGVVARAAPLTHDAPTAPPMGTAIVLGALVRDTAPSPVLEDRLACAADLHARGKVRKILVTGDHGREGYDETDAMAAWLVAHGVPEADVVRDHAGFRTLDSMDRAKHVFGVEQAIVCTQAFHLPRSLFLARSFGIDAVGVPADRRTYRGAVWNQARESVARPIAFAERLAGRRAHHTR